MTKEPEKKDLTTISQLVSEFKRFIWEEIPRKPLSKKDKQHLVDKLTIISQRHRQIVEALRKDVEVWPIDFVGDTEEKYEIKKPIKLEEKAQPPEQPKVSITEKLPRSYTVLQICPGLTSEIINPPRTFHRFFQWIFFGFKYQTKIGE